MLNNTQPLIAPCPGRMAKSGEMVTHARLTLYEVGISVVYGLVGKPGMIRTKFYPLDGEFLYFEKYPELKQLVNGYHWNEEEVRQMFDLADDERPYTVRETAARG